MRAMTRRGRRHERTELPDPSEMHARAMRFGRALAIGQATSVSDLDWGFAVLHDRFPASQQHNRVVVTERDAPVADVLEAADRILGGAGLAYRRVDVETADGGGLATSIGAFTGGVVGEELLLTMHLSGDDDQRGSGGDSPRVVVDRLPFEATAELIDRSWQIDLPTLHDEERRQLVERVPEATTVMTLTQHTVSDGTEPVALCHLLHDGSSAQVEGVYTLPEARQRGYATAIVADAVAMAQTSGCDLVFLYADADDWPQDLYRRLGFTDAGSTWTTLWSPGS